MKERLKKDLEKVIKDDMILGIIIFAIFIVVWMGCFLFVLCTYEESSSGERVLWVILLIFSAIAIIVRFLSDIMTLYKDLKTKESERYDCLRIIVIRKKYRIGGASGYKTIIVAKNLDTDEEFEFREAKNMKENEIYYMLRAKHSKQFVFEPFEPFAQEN